MKLQKFKDKKSLLISIGIVFVIAIGILYWVMFNERKVDINKLKESVVLINVYDAVGSLHSTGSGIIAIENDILITNAHVIEDIVENELYQIEVVTEEHNILEVLGVIGYSKSNDYALLKIENQKTIEPLKISKEQEKIGSEVYVIGSPLGIKNTVSDGIISNYATEEERYQFTAPISPGSSGGALVNSRGELIGVVYATVEGAQNINFAIPIEFVSNRYEKEKDNIPVPLNYADDLHHEIINDGVALDLLVKLNELNINSYDLFSQTSNEYSEYFSYLNDMHVTSYLSLTKGRIFNCDVFLQDGCASYYEIKIMKSTEVNDKTLMNLESTIEEKWSTYHQTSIDGIITKKEPDYIVRKYGSSGDYLYYIEYRDIESINQIIEVLEKVG